MYIENCVNQLQIFLAIDNKLKIIHFLNVIAVQLQTIHNNDIKF